MSKSAKIIVAIAILLVANFWLFFSGFGENIQFSEKYFNLEDLEGVSKFVFSFDEDTVKIERTGDGWMVDDEYPANQRFVNTLISVLERVEVSRTIENWDMEAMGSVEVEFDFNSRYRFEIASNPIKTKSYFITSGEAKEVVVPGYRDNVVDIFILHPDQWRNRTIIDGSWRTIQNLKVENALGEDFEITFSDKFFMVNNEQPADSSAVVDYLNQFQQFQANEMISKGRFVELDSIATTRPFALVTIDDLKNESEIQLQIFPNMEDQAYHLVVDQDSQRMVIDVGRVRQILLNPSRLN